MIYLKAYRSCLIGVMSFNIVSEIEIIEMPNMWKYCRKSFERMGFESQGSYQDVSTLRKEVPRVHKKINTFSPSFFYNRSCTRIADAVEKVTKAHITRTVLRSLMGLLYSIKVLRLRMLRL